MQARRVARTTARPWAIIISTETPTVESNP